jgi:hypothetical protein
VGWRSSTSIVPLMPPITAWSTGFNGIVAACNAVFAAGRACSTATSDRKRGYVIDSSYIMKTVSLSEDARPGPICRQLFAARCSAPESRWRRGPRFDCNATRVKADTKKSKTIKTKVQMTARLVCWTYLLDTQFDSRPHSCAHWARSSRRDRGIAGIFMRMRSDTIVMIDCTLPLL